MKSLNELIHSSSLTKTQKMIAKYILDNYSDACFMTSTEIAQELGVSESSVIRFSRSLGFTGFMDFQKELRKDYQDKVLSISSTVTVPSQRVAHRTKLESHTDSTERHYKNAIHNLETVFKTNSLMSFEKSADIILSSKRKYIAATRGNTCLCDYFSLYLKQMVPHVVMTNTASLTPIDHMCSITKEDCLVLFSFPRYSSVDKVTAEIAKEAGAQIIIITDKPSSDLAQYATLLFTVPVDSDAFFNSMVAAQFVAEAILDSIRQKARGIEKRLKKIDQYLDKLGNY